MAEKGNKFRELHHYALMHTKKSSQPCWFKELGLAGDVAGINYSTHDQPL